MNKPEGPLDNTNNETLKITYKGEDFDKIKQEFSQYIKNKEFIESQLVFTN